MEEAVGNLRLFVKLHDELTAEGEDFPMPLSGLPLARFYLAHALFNSQRAPEAEGQLLRYLDDVAAAGPQRVLNMPDGWGGKKISDAERAASRFRARASSDEALADTHTMLAMICDKRDGAAAALPHLLSCVEHATKGGVARQRAEAHENLARTYKVLGEETKAEEQREAARLVREAQAAKEAEEARKKEEDAQKATHEDGRIPEDLPDDSAAAASALADAGEPIDAD